MLTNTTIQNCMEELAVITKVAIAVFDPDGNCLAHTAEQPKGDMIRTFTDSPADSQVVAGKHMIKVYCENTLQYIVLTEGQGDSAYSVGKIASSELSALAVAYKEHFDKNNFFQNLLLDNLLLVDIYNRAKKLRVETSAKRIVFLVDTTSDMTGIITELLRGMYSESAGDIVTSVDDNKVILIKSFDKEPQRDEPLEVARQIESLINTEAMVKVRVAYGNTVGELKDVSKSYKEAKLALEVSKIFYQEKSIASYSSLGIGRLIYQLPINLCEMFIEEVFGGEIPKELDEETIAMLNKFFENNLNVSQTSDKLYVNRNTLIYRLEKIQKATGLNLREFEDALTYRIAMMVEDYLRYVKNEK